MQVTVTTTGDGDGQGWPRSFPCPRAKPGPRCAAPRGAGDPARTEWKARCAPSFSVPVPLAQLSPLFRFSSLTVSGQVRGEAGRDADCLPPHAPLILLTTSKFTVATVHKSHACWRSCRADPLYGHWP